MARVQTIFISLLLLALGVGAGYLLMGLGRDPLQGIKEVTWPQLSLLEPGFVPPELKEISETEVKIGGFVVPLSDDFSEIREFLLVPDAMSCIHVPPPPSNQMVLVNLEKSISSQLAYGPVWVKGRMNIKSYEVQFGVVSFQMDATHVQVYEDRPWK